MKQPNNPLVIFGSPRQTGNTRALLDAYLKREGVGDYVLFDCYKELPAPCLGCNACEKHFGCAQKDLEGFWQVLRDCNRMILASPVYFNGFPAPVKALLDRFQMFYSAWFSLGIRPTLQRSKQAAVLLTAGSDTADVDVVLSGLKQAFTVMNITLTETVLYSNTDRVPPEDGIPLALHQIR